ncbi:MAG: TIGR01212 family radical SAM protein, partial [Candidatus Omnitrophica bacterium]|nr:TIGR01212 family radical SAM protein [Candidatus Omnitrophota bacterium]
YVKNYEVWLEYGLPSIHNRTLALINRGHIYADFLKAVELTRRKKDIKICAHVIIGLPGESKEDILATAKELGRLKIEGIKTHPLHIIKGTKLEQFYRKGKYQALKLSQYLELATEFLEYLWPRTIIQRITADCPREFLVAPQWISEKNELLSKIEQTFQEKGSFQGKLWRAGQK